MYSLTDIALAYGYSKRTVNSHIKRLREQKVFKKTSVGKYYNYPDATNLSKLLGFNFAELERIKALNSAK